ncbi:MAG: methyltransferase domain-containing protein [Flavobacterium sp.]
MNLKYVTHNREPFFDLAKKRIHHDSKVLDVGPGSGFFAEFCGRNDFYLFEGNPKTVETLKQKHSNVYEGLLPELPFESEFFDVIHCSHVVEHLSPEVFYETLLSFDRCLKVGGYMVISAPMMWEEFYDDLSHIRPYPPKVYKNYLCKKAGNSRTRTTISDAYIMEEEVYRYRRVNPYKDYTARRDDFFFKGIVKLLRFIGDKFIRKYEKTGYTIVIKKM